MLRFVCTRTYPRALSRTPARFISTRPPAHIPTAARPLAPALPDDPEPTPEELDALGADDFGAFSVLFPPKPYVWGTAHIPPAPVPALPQASIPPYVGAPPDAPFHGDPYAGDGRIPLGGDHERRLRAAAALAAEVLSFAGQLVKEGITTAEIDARVHAYIVARGAYPSPLTYGGFPKSCCTSVNNIVAHGIPDDRPLEDGDIVNVDITVYKDGMHGDTSRTFPVGAVDAPGMHLVSRTLLALDAGIRACGPGRPFKAIGRAIHSAARDAGLSVSEQFTGHGIGAVFHRPPWIVHSPNDEPGVMLPGHCFTIEPCLIQGSNAKSWTWPDGWTASTENCARSAQFEHMVLITETGAEVLTSWPDHLGEIDT